MYLHCVCAQCPCMFASVVGINLQLRERANNPSLLYEIIWLVWPHGDGWNSVTGQRWRSGWNTGMAAFIGKQKLLGFSNSAHSVDQSNKLLWHWYKSKNRLLAKSLSWYKSQCISRSSQNGGLGIFQAAWCADLAPSRRELADKANGEQRKGLFFFSHSLGLSGVAKQLSS